MLISVPESTSGKLIYPGQKLEDGGVLFSLNGFISDLRPLLSTAGWYCVPLRTVLVSTKPNILILIPKSRSLISKVVAVDYLLLCQSVQARQIGREWKHKFLAFKNSVAAFPTQL